MKKIILLIAISVLTMNSYARNYPVARIKGVITKIKGDRVRVEDNKKQVFWMKRAEVYPRGSQLYDEVVIYKKIRFKEFMDEKKTSYFIKHRTPQMLKATREFFVNYEKEMGFTYKKAELKMKKKKYSFLENIMPYFSIETAHAQNEGDVCYIGGRKSKLVNTTDKKAFICEMPETFTCGDDGAGFLCNPRVFGSPHKDQSNKIIQSLSFTPSDDQDGFCVKHDSRNITQRCAAMTLQQYGSEPDSDLIKEDALRHLFNRAEIDDLSTEKVAIQMKKMLEDIKTICEDEEAKDSCEAYTEELKTIENEFFSKIDAKKKKQENHDKEIEIAAYKKAMKEFEEIIKGQESFHIPNQTCGATGCFPGQSPYQGQQPMIIVMQPIGQVPQYPGGSFPSTQPMTQNVTYIMMQPIVYPNSNPNVDMAKIEEYIQKRIAELEKKIKEQYQPVTPSIIDKPDPTPSIMNPMKIKISTYTYSNSVKDCEIYKAEVCMVADKNSKTGRTAYWIPAGAKTKHYSIMDPQAIIEDGKLIVGDNEYEIEQLRNTDPDVNWTCRMENPTTDDMIGLEDNLTPSTCVGKPVFCTMEDESGEKVFERLGFLSSEQEKVFSSQAPGGEGEFTFNYNSQTKLSEHTIGQVPEGEIVTPTDGSLGMAWPRHSMINTTTEKSKAPPLFTQACQEFPYESDKDESLVKASVNACLIKTVHNSGEPCTNCTPDFCAATLTCDVYDKDLTLISKSKVMDTTMTCPCSPDEKSILISSTDIDRCTYKTQQVESISKEINSTQQAQ